MKDFRHLRFYNHEATLPLGAKEELIAKGISKDSHIFKPMKHAMMKFDNNYCISVIFGEIFYSNGIDTYEIWCQEHEDEPRGYRTKDEVSDYMKEIQMLSKERDIDEGYDNSFTKTITVLLIAYLIYAMVLFEVIDKKPYTALTCDNTMIEYYTEEEPNNIVDLETGIKYNQDTCKEIKY